MPKVKYIGPFDAVEIPSIGVTVKSDEVFEVDDFQILGLIGQVDNFEPVDKSAKDALKIALLPPDPDPDLPLDAFLDINPDNTEGA